MWLTLLPLAAGSVLTPSYYLIEILLLQSPRGRSKALMFATGFAVMKLLLGAVFGFLVVTGTPGGDCGESPVVATLLLASGLLFLAMAFRQLLAAPHTDDGPPRWMATVDGITPARAFALACGMTLAAPNLWVFTLTAVATIKDTGLTTATAVITFLAFVLLTAAPMLTVVGMTALVPRTAEATLDALRTWLVAHNHVIMIAVSLVLGVALAWAGLGRLAA
ncbi:GAP family protein [Actinotalea sp. M2MS4P-6]|uniref:GAP family protein n=1 Tax=Actinotalea sp. M2MS4P-6 TaxID=2983762 RepID=UPI0021E4A3B3|nr:GAP family protein [Actinotalea sp. M2MS4P-6]MCV2394747.1 GAP family protein [Actinotalea sp. M2MS4P-6]